MAKKRLNYYSIDLKRSRAELIGSHDCKESPILLAKLLVFGERVQERNSVFYLDNHPIKSQNIIIEANKRLKAWGMNQIGHESWWV